MNRTFAFIKPCAQASGKSQAIKNDIEAAGFVITREKLLTFSREQAEWLYREHSAKSHFNDLVDFTISGPVTILELTFEAEDAAPAFRKIMGPTNIAEASPGGLRGKYAEDFRRNAIHGSDSVESAKAELAFFDANF